MDEHFWRKLPTVWSRGGENKKCYQKNTSLRVSEQESPPNSNLHTNFMNKLEPNKTNNSYAGRLIPDSPGYLEFLCLLFQCSKHLINRHGGPAYELFVHFCSGFSNLVLKTVPNYLVFRSWCKMVRLRTNQPSNSGYLIRVPYNRLTIYPNRLVWKLSKKMNLILLREKVFLWTQSFNALF